MKIQKAIRNLSLCLLGLFIGAFSQSTWTPRNSGTSYYLKSITWTGKQFVVVGGNPGGDTDIILTSPNGITWTAARDTGKNISFYPLYSVVWTGSQLVAAGNGGNIQTSPDGITWTARDTGATAKYSISSMTFTDSQLVAVGYGGTILTSPDGITWTARYSGTDYTLYSVTWTGNQLVAVGALGIILTSQDGITWRARNSGTNYILSSVTWTGSQLVAVGESILTSNDGIAWTTRDTGTTANFLSVTWTGSQLVAVGINDAGDSAAILTSTDGISWSKNNSGTYNTLFSVTCTGNQCVAVGNNGTILTSPQDVISISQYQVSNSDFHLRIDQNALFFSIPDFTQENVSATVYTLFGQKAAARNYKLVPSAQEISLPINQLAPGPYLLELNNEGKDYTKAFEITR